MTRRSKGSLETGQGVLVLGRAELENCRLAGFKAVDDRVQTHPLSHWV